MTWHLKKFDDLIPKELYAILQLRNEVFVVEQNCVYQDADNKDQLSYHLMGYDEGKLLAYTRIVPPGVSYEEPSVGRVVTSPEVRRSGIGKELMIESVKAVHRLYGNQPIRIGAQLYLRKFYESLGFKKTSEVYLEDNIEHIEMLRV
jgi:ElaA protein